MPLPLPLIRPVRGPTGPVASPASYLPAGNCSVSAHCCLIRDLRLGELAMAILHNHARRLVLKTPASATERLFLGGSRVVLGGGLGRYAANWSGAGSGSVTSQR